MVNMKFLILLYATATEASENDRKEESKTTDKGGIVQVDYNACNKQEIKGSNPFTLILKID